VAPQTGEVGLLVACVKRLGSAEAAPVGRSVHRLGENELMPPQAQLSFVVHPRVLMRYHPDMAPPDAQGPFDTGTFCASLARYPRLCACGGTERAAVEALAGRLRTVPSARKDAALNALTQVLIASELYPPEKFVDYLLLSAV